MGDDLLGKALNLGSFFTVKELVALIDLVSPRGYDEMDLVVHVR